MEQRTPIRAGLPACCASQGSGAEMIARRRTFAASEARPLERGVRHPLGLLSNEGPIGRQYEVVGERLQRPPSAVVDGAKDPKSVARLVIPMNLDLDLVGGTRGPSKLSNLRLAQQRNEFAVWTLAIVLQVGLEDGPGFPVIH
jgi:hypothetical protein